ncbi:MAG: molybdenum cofactor guanylyltransferase MobA [Rhodoferax sp.]|nr:molybdenum cofactor guanylyltransferase MobA [Rhodoferax sp.]
MDITGLILAGGRGSRMGSVDKGLVPLNGKPMVAHVLERLTPQVQHLLINANQNQEAYAAYGVPVWPDALPDFAGPLAGLQAGLMHCQTPYLVTAPCDSPFLPADLVARLAQARQAQDADLAVAVTGTGDTRQLHPVFCLVKTALLPHLNAYLESGGRKMGSWLASLKVAEVQFEDESAFHNINTADELRMHDLDRALTVAQAQRIIQDLVQPIHGQELVPTREALGRVLAHDVVSPISVPAHDNSAMDGFAFQGADLATNAATTLTIIGSAHAGHRFDSAVGHGQCVRIMTGAVMPALCDTVVPQELTQALTDTTVSIPASTIQTGENRRLKGEDLMEGKPALSRGRVLRPADMGLLASLGIAEVAVQRRLKVAFFSTGDELRSLGQPLDAGCIYDSNRYTLLGMLTRLGCELIDMGVVKDDAQSLEAALRTACENADVIITSGGVSVGEADYTKPIMAKLGDVSFWKIDMRPGRPLAFGTVASNGKRAYLFGLPGNPVAVMVTFYFFARDALLRMMGAHNTPLPHLRAASQANIRKKPGRTEYQRGILSTDATGNPVVQITGAQGSGVLHSMSQANCMVVLHHEQGPVRAGEMVDVVVFDGLV